MNKKEQLKKLEDEWKKLTAECIPGCNIQPCERCDKCIALEIATMNLLCSD